MHQHPVWPYARISAHRGGGTLAPENTLEAFRTGLRHGFAAMETDAMLAKDGVPILMHDEVFGRTIRDRQGSVPELTSLEVRTLDAGSWFSPEYCGLPPALSRPSAGAAPTAAGSTSKSSPPRGMRPKRAASSRR